MKKPAPAMGKGASSLLYRPTRPSSHSRILLRPGRRSPTHATVLERKRAFGLQIGGGRSWSVSDLGHSWSHGRFAPITVIQAFLGHAPKPTLLGAPLDDSPGRISASPVLGANGRDRTFASLRDGPKANGYRGAQQRLADARPSRLSTTVLALGCSPSRNSDYNEPSAARFIQTSRSRVVFSEETFGA